MAKRIVVEYIEKKKKSKGPRFPYEVWHIDESGYDRVYSEYKTKTEAKEDIEQSPELVAPIIRRVEIPVREY